MDLAAAGLSPQAVYKLITGIVVPRPIAWVTTKAPAGHVNLAPFSAFTFVSTKPPMVGISVGRKAGVVKDTSRNIHAAREFVVNIADETMIEDVHLSAVEHPPEVSEVELLGLPTAPSTMIATPRLAGVPISLECRLHQVIAFGDTGSEFMVGEIVMFHFREGLLQDGKVDTAQLRPICRLAGPRYARLGEIVAMRPIAQTPKTVLGDES
jgi:flavin reductase (DIM6/NTAB) family NADH-FMN oxidoreductase RutF